MAGLAEGRLALLSSAPRCRNRIPQSVVRLKKIGWPVLRWGSEAYVMRYVSLNRPGSSGDLVT